MAKILIIGSGLIATRLEQKWRETNKHDVDIISTTAFFSLRGLVSDHDCVVLCAKPRDTKALVDRIHKDVKIIDTSYLYRTDPEWLYGLELISGDSLIGANRVANAGCIATGSLILLNPLTKLNNLINENVLINATCGVSAGGKRLIEKAWMNEIPPEYLSIPDGEHPHVPEIKKYAKLMSQVVVIPSIVKNVNRGMTVKILLWNTNARYVSEAYQNEYWKNEKIDIFYGKRYININDFEFTKKCHLFIEQLGDNVLVAANYDNIEFAGVDNIDRNVDMMLNFEKRGM